MVASNRRRRGVYSMRHAYLLKPCSFQIVSYRHVDTCTPYMYYLHKKFANVRWGGHRTGTGHQEKNLGPGADGSGAAAFSRGSSSFGRARHWVASANPGSALAETQHSKQRLATLTAAFQDRIGDLGPCWKVDSRLEASSPLHLSSHKNFALAFGQAAWSCLCELSSWSVYSMLLFVTLYFTALLDLFMAFQFSAASCSSSTALKRALKHMNCTAHGTRWWRTFGTNGPMRARWRVCQMMTCWKCWQRTWTQRMWSNLIKSIEAFWKYKHAVCCTLL